MISHKDLGEYQPYAVADRFGLNASLFEAFKKLTCAGNVSDRQLKTVKQEYQEAINGIDYALDNLTKFHLTKTAKDDYIRYVIGQYKSLIPDYNHYAIDAATAILFFAVTSQVTHLKQARERAVLALESLND